MFEVEDDCIKIDVHDKKKRRDDQWNKGEEDESRQKWHETSPIFSIIYRPMMQGHEQHLSILRWPVYESLPTQHFPLFDSIQMLFSHFINYK